MPLQSKSGVFQPAESPFFDIFEKNRVPSFDERKTLHQLVAEKTDHLVHLNSQIPKRRPGKKQTVSSELRAELAYTRRWLDFHRALIAPWQQLPAEILSEIFLFTLDYRGERDRPWHDDRAGTLLVCKICSPWRVIALKTPALWNTLSIRISRMGGSPKWLSTWLDRSRSAPVHLQLLWDSESPPEIMNSVMSAFASHLHHTAELAIDGLCFPEPMEVYRKLTFKPSEKSLDAPLLSAVVALLPPGSVWDLIHAACSAASCLTHLTTSHSSLDLFPLTNLTEFNWRHQAPMSQVFHIFENTPNLKHVDIRVVGPVVASSTKSRLTMKSISTLNLSSYMYLGEFLEQSEFPSLVNLRCSDVRTWPGPLFHSCLSRSSCALTVLAFHRCYISAAEIVACLQHSACNTLESLIVQECAPRNGDALVQYLTYRGPEHPPCSNPNLSTITLLELRFTDGLLSAMVESRCSTTLPSGPPEPVRLTEIAFSMAGAVIRFDYPKDWKRLRQIEKMKVLKIRWPTIELGVF